MIRTLLADDHNLFREGLRSILEQEPEIELVADTNNGTAAVELSLKLKPDVAILDISMPGLNGIEAAGRILADNPETGVIILSMHADREYVLTALKSGVKGFLAKSCTSAELIDAIRATSAQQTYLSPSISNVLVDELITRPQKEENPLSRRELQVLRLLTEGQCTKEIASTLEISTKTVECYRHNLMKKLGISNVAGLVRYAIREGIIKVT